jgi:hypothetical protein
MSLFLPLQRATLLVPSGPITDIDRKHLFILLTDYMLDEANTQSVLMVSLSSVKQNIPYDASCVLHAGEHSFVKRDSYVVYQKARIEATDKLLRGIKDGKLIPQEPMKKEVFDKVIAGLLTSPFTTPTVLNFYQRHERSKVLDELTAQAQALGMGY